MDQDSDQKASKVVRREISNDLREIFAINAASFDRENEAQLVDSLRASGQLHLSMVCEDLTKRPALLGHIAFSPVKLTNVKDDEEPVKALGLGPLAVRPGHQKQGIGSLLVNTAINECKDLGIALVFVLGDPKFYNRFGFAKAADFKLAWNHGEPAYFQVLEMEENTLERFARAATPVTVSYSQLFDSC